MVGGDGLNTDSIQHSPIGCPKPLEVKRNVPPLDSSKSDFVLLKRTFAHYQMELAHWLPYLGFRKSDLNEFRIEQDRL